MKEQRRTRWQEAVKQELVARSDDVPATCADRGVPSLLEGGCDACGALGLRCLRETLEEHVGSMQGGRLRQMYTALVCVPCRSKLHLGQPLDFFQGKLLVHCPLTT